MAKKSMIPYLSAALLMTVQSGLARADEPSALTISPVATLASDYVSRGLSLNWGNPALQAGIDAMHRSGWYLGAWAGQVTGRFYAGGAFEFDLYAGHRGNLGDQLAYDAGLASYFYPGANYSKAFPPGAYPDRRYDTTEAVVGLTYQWFNLKYAHCLTDYFGYDSRTVPLGPWNSGISGGVTAGQGTRGSGYLEANATFDLGESVSLGMHAGHQNVVNSHRLSYSDYKLSLGKSFSQGWSALAAYTVTQGAEIYSSFLSVSGNQQTANVSGSHWLASVSKGF